MSSRESTVEEYTEQVNKEFDLYQSILLEEHEKFGEYIKNMKGAAFSDLCSSDGHIIERRVIFYRELYEMFKEKENEAMENKIRNKTSGI